MSPPVPTSASLAVRFNPPRLRAVIFRLTSAVPGCHGPGEADHPFRQCEPRMDARREPKARHRRDQQPRIERLRPADDDRVPAARADPGPAAARRRCLSAHGDPAVRGSREVDRRARSGDEGRQADPAGRADAAPTWTTRRATTSIASARIATILQLLKLPDGTVKVLVEGVERARVDALHAGAGYLPRSRRSPKDRSRYDDPRGRRARAPVVDAVRAVRQAEPQGFRRRSLTRWPASTQPGRLADTDRRAHVAQARWTSSSVLEIQDVREPARALARADRGRDRHAAAREAHPRARQAADGEEPARVLPATSR